MSILSTAYELLWRKLCIKFFGAKYCDYTTRHAHSLEYVCCGGKDITKYRLYRCTVCRDYIVSDYSGLQLVSISDAIVLINIKKD